MVKNKSKEAEKFVKGRVNSFTAAFQGLRYVLKTQKNAWIHLAATVIVLGASTFLQISRMEWIAILLVIGVVWTAEFLNTALEVLVDLTNPELHPLAKISKDVGAASVLIAAFLSVIIGILIFAPAIATKFGLFSLFE
ncbi:MAG: diacylglycerol kinase family protein [Chloroflexi bacterium]|jgi:diacylglycerol kinase|nr:diacylglycerol kinase family protein [Chloroflexota bacterium]